MNKPPLKKVSSSVSVHLDLPKKAMNSEVQLLIFSLGKQSAESSSQQLPSLFGINIFKIREVIKKYQWVSAPQQDKRLLGLLLLRGEWVPILNTFASLNYDETDLAQERPLILIEYSNRLYGIVVEHISGIDSVFWKDIHTVSRMYDENTSLITGVGVSQRFGEFMVLDVDRCIINAFPNILDIDLKDFASVEDKKRYCGCTAFLADDSSILRKQLTQCLEMLGLEVFAFENGACLFQKLMTVKEESIASGRTSCHPHFLIITDIEMPEMDGISLVKQIKADPFYAETRTIIYSSLSTLTSRQIGIGVGADDVIQKLNTATLLQTVKSHLNDIIKKPA